MLVSVCLFLFNLIFFLALSRTSGFLLYPGHFGHYETGFYLNVFLEVSSDTVPVGGRECCLIVVRYG